MRIVVTHPTGNQNVRAVLDAFSKADILEQFYTTIALNSKNKFLRLLPGNLYQEALRRTFLLPAHKIKTDPLLEFSRLILPKLGLRSLVQSENALASVDSVYKAFDRKAAKLLMKTIGTHSIDAVYAYEDGALETFKAAKEKGIKCIYDLPIAYWETLRTLLEAEALRLPLWAPTLAGGITDSAEKLERKTQEMELADIVVGPGKFVIDSIPGWAKQKLQIVSPFGSPVSSESNLKAEKTGILKRPLRILFVGSMGQRKGLGDLFQAMKILNRSDVQLVVLGSLMAPMTFYKSECPDFIYEAGRPHQQVLELMRSCDVFCLPSIVEGRALVMQEAMSQGLPLIITPNTGGEDLIVEGKTGFLVPISSPQQIADKINWLADNRSAIPEMGRMAKELASSYTWPGYGETIVESLNKYLG